MTGVCACRLRRGVWKGSASRCRFAMARAQYAKGQSCSIPPQSTKKCVGGWGGRGAPLGPPIAGGVSRAQAEDAPEHVLVRVTKELARRGRWRSRLRRRTRPGPWCLAAGQYWRSIARFRQTPKRGAGLRRPASDRRSNSAIVFDRQDRRIARIRGIIAPFFCRCRRAYRLTMSHFVRSRSRWRESVFRVVESVRITGLRVVCPEAVGASVVRPEKLHAYFLDEGRGFAAQRHTVGPNDQVSGRIGSRSLLSD